MNIFRLYPGEKLSFEHNCFHKKLFLSACFSCDSRLSLCEMDQNFIFGGTIGCGDSYLEFLFNHFKVFRPHAILHDAAGAVQAYSGKCPGYYYTMGRVANSRLFRHMTGLLFRLYVEPFLPCIFNSVTF